MKAVRLGVFETNSSSTHSLALCMKSQYEDWKAGKVYLYSPYGKEIEFLTEDEAKAKVTDDIPDGYTWETWEESNKIECLKESDIWTYEEWCDAHEDSYDFEQEYTTPGKETVIAFGYYGDQY